MSDNAEYRFRNFVDRQLRGICEANHADHKPTYEPELERERIRLKTLFDRGQTFIATLTATDVGCCRAVYERQQRKSPGWSFSREGPDDLVEAHLQKTWMLVPRYIATYNEMCTLRGIFTSRTEG